MTAERHKRPTRLDFFEDDLDYGDVQIHGYLWRDLYKRRQQELWLDSLSEPPDESTLYGESLVIEGVRVGEWKWADKTEPDDVPFSPSHHKGIRPLSDEEREALIELQRQPPRLKLVPKPEVEEEPFWVREEREKKEIRAALRRMPVPPVLARRWREYHEQDYDDRAEAERLKQRREQERLARLEYERETFRRTVESLKPKPPPPPPEPARPRPHPRPLGLPQPGEIMRFPKPVEPVVVQHFVRLTSKDGIEHIIPLDVYERFGREAVLLPGVDPPIWVLYRLGLGWNE